jgi:hypothetical protein
MTDQEWGDIVAMLRHWWPGDFSEAAAEGYRLRLRREDPGTLARTIGNLLDRGQTFRPAVSEIIAAMQMPTHRAMGPDEAWALMEDASRQFGCSIYDPAFAERHQAAIDWIAERDVVVAAFAARRGLFQIEGSLMQEAVNDPAFGGAARARIGKDYREHAQTCADRVGRGLPAVERRMLTVRSPRTDAGGGMDELLARLRPEDVRELEAGAEAIEGEE